MSDENLTACAADHQDVLRRLNDTARPYPQHQRVHELFEDQVQRTPHAIAVEHRGEALTYSELNQQANQLAHYLIKRKVGPDRLVGICVERCPQMVVALLGALKAGGAYLPLDPSYPPERLQLMLEDAAPQVVLTQEKLRASLPDTAADVIALDVKGQEIKGYSDHNAPRGGSRVSSRNLVYVIYTSGSTGKPKGIGMAHHSMVSLIEWHRATLAHNEGARVLQFAALSFDVAFQETFSTLCTGGTLILLDEWIRRDARALCDLLREQAIERLFLPPLMLQSIAQSCAPDRMPSKLKDVITAGEQLRITADIVALFKGLEDCRLHNHYGPTETHVVTALTLDGDPDKWPALPTIGQPIFNAQIYVLDEQMKPAPIGIEGEIYIGGAGVARGYLRRPELTEQRFVSDPFSADAQARLYKTGDLGRWTPEGVIEFLGRNDDQVKIRGFRIELGEIEAQLTRHAQVREAVVVAREEAPGERRLVAYITARDPGASLTEYLREHLRAALPDYMIPSAFVVLDSMPLTPNGKLDRRALPAPDINAYVSRPYEAPRGELEAMLAEIWQGLLRVGRVGRADNFFELGGHSLLMVQMMEQLRRKGLSPQVQSLYTSATLAELAEALRDASVDVLDVPPNLIPTDCAEITPEMLPLMAPKPLKPHHIERIVQKVSGGVANVQDLYPLAPLQEGILFHHLLNKQGDTYVLPILLSLSSRQKLDALIAALQRVIERHDILRTAIFWEQLPRAVQVVQRRAVLQAQELALDPGRDALEQLRARMAPEEQRLDLRQAPLMRLQVAATAQDQWCALLQVHHLICDHESLESLLEEVMTHIEGRGHTLPEPMPFRDHVAHAIAQSRKEEAQRFFKSKLADVREPTIPFGIVDVHGDGERIEQASQSLDPALAMSLRAQARRLNVAPTALFHAAWALVIARASERDDVVFGSLLSGRQYGQAGAQRVLGLFINTLPLRLPLKGLSVRDLVERAQRELVQLLPHEQASLAAVQRCSGIAGSLPLFSALLNYLHSKPIAETDGVRVLEIKEWTNYPLTLCVDDQDESFLLTAQTDRRIDPQRMLRYVSASLWSLVTALNDAPGTLALALEMAPPEQMLKPIERASVSAQAPSIH